MRYPARISVPWIRLAARVLERYEQEELVAFTSPWRRIVDDFADHLAGVAGKDDLGGLIAEWLLDKEGVDDVFTTDDTLATVVIEMARKVAEEPEPEPEPEPEFDEDEDEDGGLDLAMALGLGGGKRKSGGTGKGGGGLPEGLMQELLSPIDPGELDRQVWMAQWSRQSFTPATKKGDGPVGVSKFGGAAFLPRGERWPVCPGCDQPMRLFVQLDLADLPELMPHPHRMGLVQLFYCTSKEPECEANHEAWQPFAKSAVARWLPADALAEEAEPASDPTGGPVAVLDKWDEGPLELPVYPEEIPEPPPEGLEELEDDAYEPRAGDKLGGWPAWAQGPETPKCPECQKPMEYLLQLDSGGLTHHQFGDGGTGHLFQCGQHAHVVAFGWACS